MNLAEKVKKARLKLYTKGLLFFGIMAYKFTWKFEKPQVDFWEAMVKFNPNQLDQLESGSITYNQNLVENSDYTYENLAFVTCHELLHILNKHGNRKADRRHDVWNVACDHVVEVELKKMNNIFTPYKNKYNIVPELEKEMPGCTAERAYKWLMEHNSYPSRIQKNPQTGMIQVQDQHGNTMFEVQPMQGGSDSKGQTPQKVKGMVDQFVSEARSIFTDMKNKGNVPSNMVEYLDKILKVEIPWEDLLEKAIKTSVIMKPDGRSWRSLNKYYLGIGMTLPGYDYVEENDGVGKLVIHLDRSGSINRDELKKFAYIIKKSMQYFKNVHVLVHDVDIHTERIFNKDDIGQFWYFIKNELKGGGGTSHSYVFKKTQEIWDEDLDSLSMVISLTDNYSDIEHIYKDYEWIKNNVPLVILTTTNNILNLDEKFGNIEQIEIK